MKLYKFLGMLILGVGLFMSIAWTTKIDQEWSKMENHDVFAAQIQLDLVKDITTTKLIDGTFDVKVTGMKSGKLVETSFTALYYSADGSCWCDSCSAQDPRYRFRKFRIGANCWCVMCSVIEPPSSN